LLKRFSGYWHGSTFAMFSDDKKKIAIVNK